MGKIFASFWRCLTAVVDVLWPLGRHAKLPAAVRWTLHLLLVLVVIVGLFVLQRYVSPPSWLRSPVMQRIYLPLMFLLIYLLALIGWWLWKLLAFEQESSSFPDIDAAWREAMYALAQAGIRLNEVPVFLIVGRPESAERNLFEAARLNLVVKPTPQDPGAPLHVCADREGVYVTCVGASVLGRWAGILGLEEMGHAIQRDTSTPDTDVTKTIIPTRKQSQLVEELDDTDTEELTTLQRRRNRRYIGMPLGPDILSDAHEVRRLSNRLAHLCRLIARDRQPYCPINGILLLVPLGGTDTTEDARQTRDACRHDLDTVRGVFHMNCPLFALACDLESFPGFKEFMRRQQASHLVRRLGQRFPLATNLAQDDHVDKVRSAIHWLSNAFVQKLIYKYFQVERVGEADPAALMAGNTALFLFLDEMRDRGDRLGDILTHAVARDDDEPWMFGGCYLGATGGRGEQAFIHDLFKRLWDEQNSVTWTPAAVAEDAACHAQTKTGYALMSLAWLAIVGLVVWLIWHFRKS